MMHNKMQLKLEKKLYMTNNAFTIRIPTRFFFAWFFPTDNKEEFETLLAMKINYDMDWCPSCLRMRWMQISQ